MPALSSRRKQQLRDLLLANLTLVATLLASFAGAVLLHSFTDNAIALSAIPLLAATIVVTTVAVVLHPAATCESLGLGSRAIPSAFWGALLGALACGLAVAVSVFFQWGALTPVDPSVLRFDWRDTWFVGLALLMIGAMGEELFMRGLLLQLLARAVGPVAAVAATSIAFALLHGANPNVTVIAQINTALFGVLFGIAVVRKRSLWLAVGLHLGWNVAQGVLGVNISGITMRLTELNFEPRGTGWLVGGDYGLEGGVLATCMVVLLAAVVWVRPKPGGPERVFWDAANSEASEPVSIGGSLLGDLPGRNLDSGGAGKHREVDGGAARHPHSEPER